MSSLGFAALFCVFLVLSGAPGQGARLTETPCRLPMQLACNKRFGSESAERSVTAAWPTSCMLAFCHNAAAKAD